MPLVDQTADASQRTGLTVPHIDMNWPMRRRPTLSPREAVAPVSLTVTITANDPLTAEGARAWLEVTAGIQVVPWSERRQAQAAVVLAHEVTAQVLARIDEAGQAPDGNKLPVVLVTGRCNERQLLDAVARGAVGVLLRDDTTYQDVIEAVRQILKGEAPLPPPMVRALVDRLHSFRTKPHPQTWPFTPREVEVLRYMAEGLSTAEVAELLNYSERTIKNIVHEVVQRLNLRNRTHAVAYAIRSGAV